MYAAIFLIAVGIGAITLGKKGFGDTGLPLTEEKRITGGAAKIIGVICIVLGIGIFGLGVAILLAKCSRCSVLI
jgi:hypothetical protein